MWQAHMPTVAEAVAVLLIQLAARVAQPAAATVLRHQLRQLRAQRIPAAAVAAATVARRNVLDSLAVVVWS
jgi:hypothetical protein